jgi:hypothetical protein
MKWWAYSEFEENGITYVNLLLDHNTTKQVKWYNSGSSTSGGGDNTQGPLTLLAQLKNDTSNWNALPNRTDSYVVRRGPYPSTNEYVDVYTIDYSSYKARALTYEEERAITICDVKKANPTNSWLDSNTSKNGTPAKGYWTSSIGTYTVNQAYGVISDQSYGAIPAGSNDLGVRPVITLPKDSITME